MDVEQREHVVSGFAFYSEKDARLAEQERQKIAYLDKRIDHTDIQSVLAIYKTALEDRVFRTPVGLEYLRDPADAGRRGQKGGSLPVSDHEHRDDCGDHCHVCDHIEFRPTQYPELRAESSE